METAVTRAFVKALKEKHTAIANAEKSKPKAPFIRFKVMEEVGLTVVNGFDLAEDPRREMSDLITTLHSSMIEATNSELILLSKRKTAGADTVAPSVPDYRPIRPDNVIMTYLTAMRLSEKLSTMRGLSDEVKHVLEFKDDFFSFMNRLSTGQLVPTPTIVVTGNRFLWAMSTPYMFDLLGEERHGIFALRYGQANEFLVEIEGTEKHHGN
ncbi:Uncharacterised protein [uncultured archaeon]|nr:Uncharacterised protein [uncultured archaeon]